MTRYARVDRFGTGVTGGRRAAGLTLPSFATRLRNDIIGGNG